MTLVGKLFELAALDLGPRGKLSAVAARREAARGGKVAAEKAALEVGDGQPVLADRSGQRGALQP